MREYYVKIRRVRDGLYRGASPDSRSRCVHVVAVTAVVHDEEADLWHNAKTAYHQLGHGQPVWLNLNRYSFRDINLHAKCHNLEHSQDGARAESQRSRGRCRGRSRGHSRGVVGLWVVPLQRSNMIRRSHSRRILTLYDVLSHPDPACFSLGKLHSY